MDPEHRQAIECARLRMGAALLEMQQLGARYNEAVGKVERAYMDLAEVTADLAAPVMPDQVNDLA